MKVILGVVVLVFSARFFPGPRLTYGMLKITISNLKGATGSPSWIQR